MIAYAVILSVQVKELYVWKDTCECTFLDKVQFKTIIDLSYTNCILTV